MPRDDAPSTASLRDPERDPATDPTTDPTSVPSVLETAFDQPETLAEALAESLADDLRRAVEERGAASLVVSGGSTPLPLFAALSKTPLPWEKVWVTLADERWVEPSDAASNEKLVRDHLLRGAAAAARFVALKTPAATPEEGEAECEARLAEMPRPFDVVVLGMGGDGHTASLFPDAPELAQALELDSGRLCRAMRPAKTPNPRITLTLPALIESRRVVIHITGEAKREVYRQALTPGPAQELPVRAVLNHGPEPLDVYWSP